MDQQRHQLDVMRTLTVYLHSKLERCETTARSAGGNPIRSNTSYAKHPIQSKEDSNYSVLFHPCYEL